LNFIRHSQLIHPRLGYAAMAFSMEEHYHVAVSAVLCVARFIVAFLPMSKAVSEQSFCLDYYMF
jgi:hypothetical protein